LPNGPIAAQSGAGRDVLGVGLPGRALVIIMSFMVEQRSALITTTCCLLLGFTTLADAEVSQAVVDSISAAVSQGSVDDLTTIRNQVSAGDDAESIYLRAYFDWRIAGLLDDSQKKQRKAILKDARRELSRALENNPEDAEVLALRGSVIGQSITGAFSGMRLGPKASRDLDNAFELAPANPRVALLRGINFYFTPAAFGGGKDKAESEFARARALFADADSDSGWPDWGQVDVLAWLGQMLAEQGKSEEAAAIYDEALRLDSDHHWILQLKSALVNKPAT